MTRRTRHLRRRFVGWLGLEPPTKAPTIVPELARFFLKELMAGLWAMIVSKGDTNP
jgi:hypothetical protein